MLVSISSEAARFPSKTNADYTANKETIWWGGNTMCHRWRPCFWYFSTWRNAAVFSNDLTWLWPSVEEESSERCGYKLYGECRAQLRETFKKIEHIALTTEIWMNSRRTHFLFITAHYYDDQMRYSSKVISFRRFHGRHLAVRLKAFITREIEKLNIMTRIVSITSDNGSDIKAATSSYRFGTRYSCTAHNLNLTISTALDLWKKKKANR